VSDEKVSVRFDRFIGTLSLELGARQITIDDLPNDTRFLFSGETDQDQHALWVTLDEADVLVKMVNHIIEKVRVSEHAKETLTELLPRIIAVRDEAVGSD
jgi:hypothetical protein